MDRRGRKLAVGIVVTFWLVVPTRTDAVQINYTSQSMFTYLRGPAEPPRYTSIYLGARPDLHEADGRLVNGQTGASYAFQRPATVEYASRQPLDRWSDLPKSVAWQGISSPIQQTYSMKPLAANDAGTVLGLIPIPGSRASDPDLRRDYMYTTRGADGSHSNLMLAAYQGSGQAQPILTESNQILAHVGGFQRLIDVATNSSWETMQLIPDELKERYSHFSIEGISSRGDLLVDAWQDPNGPADAYLFSAAAQEAAVPEPSTLWLAAATIAGLAVRARSRRAA